MHPTRHPRSSRYCSSRSDAAGTHTSFRLLIQHRSPSFIRFLHFSLSYCFFYRFSVFFFNFYLSVSYFLFFLLLLHSVVITAAIRRRSPGHPLARLPDTPCLRTVLQIRLRINRSALLLSYLRFRSPSWLRCLRFQRTRTISILGRLWDR